MAALDESKKSNFFPDDKNWWQMPQDCEKCHLPMHMASGQDVAFCPNCAIDMKNAYNGRAMLALAKARDLQQRLIKAEEDKLRVKDEDDDGPAGGAFGSGMAL